MKRSYEQLRKVIDDINTRTPLTYKDIKEQSGYNVNRGIIKRLYGDDLPFNKVSSLRRPNQKNTIKKKTSGHDTSGTEVTHETAVGIFLMYPDVILKTGADLKQYIPNTISPVCTKSGKMVLEDIDNKIQIRHFQKDAILDQDIIDDARQIAIVLRERVGIPDSDRIIYWAGPGGGRCYGPSDIVYCVNGKYIGISLKYKEGAVHNSTLSKFGGIMLNNVSLDGVDFKTYISKDHIELDNLTEKWVSFILRLIKDKVENNENLIDTILGFNVMSYKDLQNITLTSHELDVFGRYGFSHKKNTVGKRLTKILESFRTGNPQLDTEWGEIRNASFERILDEYFHTDVDTINGNLTRSFYTMMGIGDFEYWYVSRSGEKLFCVPDIDKADKITKDLNLSYTAQKCGSGYHCIITVKDGDDMVVELEMIYRYGNGQMVGNFNSMAAKGRIKEINITKWDELFGTPI